METITRPVRLTLVTTIPVWIVAVIGAVAVTVFTDGNHYLIWLPLVLAATIILTFVLQLATREKDGLVDRTMLSLSGSLIVLAVTTAVLSLLSLR